MKVVILCGGEGTRMKEETEFKPKPLVEVGGKPILWHIMKIYAHYGFNDFIFTLGYKGNMIKEYFLNWRTFANDFTMKTGQNQLEFHNNGHDDFKITFVDTGLKSLTGERVRRIQPYLNGEGFMLTYGDGVANINIRQLLEYHQSQNTVATITGARPLTKFGIVEHDPQTGLVTGFRQNLAELRQNEQDYYNFLINGGFMVFKHEVFNYIKPNSMIEEIFAPLAQQKQLALYHHPGKWKAMDTYKEVEEMNDYWQKDPFWKVWENPQPAPTLLPPTPNNFSPAVTIGSLASLTKLSYEPRAMERLNSGSLFGKNVLVTGGTGLVGGHLVESLLAAGANVFCTVRSKNPKAYFYQKQFDQKTVTVNCDITDYGRVLDVVTKYEIEYIFHLAAQPIVTTSFINPRQTFNANVLGTVNILEAARSSPFIKGVVVASSDKAYGKNCTNATEENPLQGDHPYDVSKSTADLIARAYHNTYGLPVAVSRFGNIYGPGDLNLNRLVPGIMKSLFLGGTLEIRSDGKFVRDYVYVKDVVDGYMLLAEQIGRSKGEAFNFSSGHNFSVLDFVDRVSKVAGQQVPYKILNNQENEIPFQSLNFQKAQNVLGWRPKFGFDEAMRETYLWYKDFFGQ